MTPSIVASDAFAIASNDCGLEVSVPGALGPLHEAPTAARRSTVTVRN